MPDRTYIAIDLKSFYASVECADRRLDPLATNLVVADGRKPGGEYRTVSGAVKSISSISRTITLMDGWTVSLDEISALEETDSKSGQTGKGNDDND